MAHALCRSAIDYRNMYHILASEGQRQYGSFRWKNQSLSLAILVSAADSPGLVELAGAILAGIGCVQQQVNLAAAQRHVDLLASGDEGSCPRFQAEAIER
jgi:hypothetical protein